MNKTIRVYDPMNPISTAEAATAAPAVLPHSRRKSTLNHKNASGGGISDRARMKSLLVTFKDVYLEYVLVRLDKSLKRFYFSLLSEHAETGQVSAFKNNLKLVPHNK